MEEKKVIKLKLNIIIAIILVALIIVGMILFWIFWKKKEIPISNSEIKKIANDYQYEIEDEQLKKFYNDLLGEGTLIVSKESVSTLDEAKNLSLEYKDKLNEGISNELNTSSYESYTEFEYIDLIETTYYYKYIGEYTYKYRRTSTLIEDHSQKYTFLVFKSDYFDFPYLKKYSDSYEIKEFGDILAVINYGNKKIIKSEVEDNGESFTYNLYYISKSYSGPKPDSSGLAPAVITGEHYSLERASFTIDKSTGKSDLSIKQSSYQGYLDYKNSYYPYMNIEIIEAFSEWGQVNHKIFIFEVKTSIELGEVEFGIFINSNKFKEWNDLIKLIKEYFKK